MLNGIHQLGSLRYIGSQKNNQKRIPQIIANVSFFAFPNDGTWGTPCCHIQEIIQHGRQGDSLGKLCDPPTEKKKGNFTKTADLTLSLLTGAFDVGLLDGLGCWGCWDYEIHSRGSFPKIPYV